MMKLFIWADPYQVSYGGSLLYAVAENAEAAKAIASRSKLQKFGMYEQEHSPNAMNLGEPTRVLDLPCAEWYEWSE